MTAASALSASIPSSPDTSHSSNSRQSTFHLSLPLTQNSHITIQPFSRTPVPLLETLLDLSHPVTNIWPDFITYGPSESNVLFERLMVEERWMGFQLAAIFHPTPAPPLTASDLDSQTAPGAKIIGQANSIPFHWPTPVDNTTLPDRGWDRVLAMGSFPDEAPGPANALSALSVAIDPEYRAKKLGGIDLATEMLKGLKQIAQDHGFKALVVPVRPTRKSAGGNVWVDMDQYVRTRRGEDPTTKISGNPGGVGREDEKGLDKMDQSDLYDPWLRKHIEMGAKVVKVCWRSTVIERAVDDWEKWTGVSFKVPSVNPCRYIRGKDWGDTGEEDTKKSYEVVIPGGLVPVKVFPARKFMEEDGEGIVGVGLYEEPNVWVRHF